MAGVETSVSGVAVDAQVSTNNEELSAHGDPSLLALVNPMQGTNSSIPFSRGNPLPIIALPFGMGIGHCNPTMSQDGCSIPGSIASKVWD